jgi:uncharacterized protein YdeI (YjbR/CyaY-like superfamily)
MPTPRSNKTPDARQERTASAGRLFAPAGKEKEPEVPGALHAALAAAPIAKAKWSELTPIARRDFVSWINSAKQETTRMSRIEKACDMLAKGKRRPCCYSIVSLDLHLALKAVPEAKAQWSELSSEERRDFIAWMDSAKEKEAHRRRIEEVCKLLAAGKPCP